jgi:hypothetical protein
VQPAFHCNEIGFFANKTRKTTIDRPSRGLVALSRGREGTFATRPAMRTAMRCAFSLCLNDKQREASEEQTSMPS